MCSVHVKTNRLNFCDYKDCPLQKTVCTSNQSSVVSFNTSYKQLFTFSEIKLLKMSKISEKVKSSVITFTTYRCILIFSRCLYTYFSKPSRVGLRNPFIFQISKNVYKHLILIKKKER